MSRKLMAILVSSAMVFGSVSTSALSATDASQNQVVQTVAKNQSPLPAGGAAGIKEAQGIENSAWLGIGLVAGIVLIAWLLLDDDDEDDSSSGTD
jgi:hypothetical protein